MGDTRGLGLFWTLELVTDKESNQPLRKTTEKYSKTIVSELATYLLEEKNIYVPSDKFGVWVVPPLIVSEDEIDFFIQGIEEGLAHFRL